MPSEPSPLFASVRDTPQFREQVQGLDRSVDDLEARLIRVHKASCKYREALQLLCSSQGEFANALLDCRTYGDSDSSVKGNDELGRISEYIHELAGLNDVLRTNHEHLLCESIDRFWLKGSIQACRESRRRMDRATAEYDAAAKRYLNQSKVPGRWRASDTAEKADKARLDMLHAEAVAQEARFACVRRLVEVDGKQRYAFLEGAMQTLAAHVRCANRSAECMKRAEGVLDETKGHITTLRDEEQAQYNATESMISESQAQAASRSRHTMAHRASDLAGNMLRTTDRIAEQVRQTAAGQGVTVLKEGFLLKRAQKGMVRSWDRRFFTLNSLGVLSYQSAKQAKLDGKAPSRQLNVMDASVASGCEEVSRQHCFTVQSTDDGPRGAVFELQAESPADQQEWMTTIHAVAVAARDGSLEQEQEQQQQPRPRAASHSLGSMPKFPADLQSALSGIDTTVPEPPSPDSSRTASSRETAFQRDRPRPQSDGFPRADADGSQRSASSQAASEVHGPQPSAAVPDRSAGPPAPAEDYVNPFEALMKQQPPAARAAQHPTSADTNPFEQLMQQQQQPAPSEPAQTHSRQQPLSAQKDSARPPAPSALPPAEPVLTHLPESFRLQPGDVPAGSQDSPPATPSMAQASINGPAWASPPATSARHADAAHSADQPVGPSSSTPSQPANELASTPVQQPNTGALAGAPASRDGTPDRLPLRGQSADAEQRFPTPTRQPGFPKSLARPGHVPARGSESAAPNFPMPCMPAMPLMPAMPQPAAASASPRVGDGSLQLRWSSSSLGRHTDESSPRSPSQGNLGSAALGSPTWRTQPEASPLRDAAPVRPVQAHADPSVRQHDSAGTADTVSAGPPASPFPRPAMDSTAGSAATPMSRLAAPHFARMSPDLMHQPAAATAQAPAAHEPSTPPQHGAAAHAAVSNAPSMETLAAQTGPLPPNDMPSQGRLRPESEAADEAAAYAGPAQPDDYRPAEPSARPEADITHLSAPADASNPFAELLQQGSSSQTAYPTIDVADISLPASTVAAPAARMHKRNPSWDADAVRVRPQPVQPFRQARPELSRADPAAARAAAMQKSGGLLQSLLGQPRYQQQRQQQQPGLGPQHAQPQYPPPAAAMRSASVYASAPQFPPLAHGRTSSAGSDSDISSPFPGSGQHGRSQSSTLPAELPASQRREQAHSGVAPRAASPMTNARSEPLDQDLPARARSPQPFRSSMASPMRDAYARGSVPPKAAGPSKSRAASLPPPQDDALSELERRLAALLN